MFSNEKKLDVSDSLVKTIHLFAAYMEDHKVHFGVVVSREN